MSSGKEPSELPAKHRFLLVCLQFTEMSSFEGFSDEILEEIFNYLPGCSIPKLTTVCTRFNDVISSSVKLMNNFEVQWSKNKHLDMRPLLQSTRKYRKMQINSITGLKHNLFQFIADHRKTLTSLHFFECSFAVSEIRIILDLVSANLEEFSLCEVNLAADVEMHPMSFPKLKVIDLMYGRCNGFVSIIKAFEGSQIDQFQYEDDFEMSPQDIEVFKSFLVSQKNLRELSLTHNVTRSLFASQDFGTSVQFKAENIFVWMGDEHQESGNPASSVNILKNFSQFLETQRESLKVLTLGRCKLQRPFMDTLLLFLKLKDLRLVQNDFDWDGDLFTVNTTLERMFVSLQDTTIDEPICQIMENCLKLREMKFSCIDVTFKMSMVMAYKLKSLTKCEFFNCKLIPITFPNMKKMSFSSCAMRDVLQQILVNRHLRKVTIPFSYCQDENFLSSIIVDARIRAIVFDPTF